MTVLVPKQWLYLFFGVAALVILFLFVSRDDSANKTVQDTSGQQTTPQNDSMASHHGSQPANTAVFDSLMGKPAPDFTLVDYQGKQVSLSSLKGQNVILFFNEGLMCYPSCWNQIAAFGQDTNLKGKSLVFNIVIDSKEAWSKALDKMPELKSAEVLFDTGGKVSASYGMLTLPSSMHKGQYPGHTYVVIDKEGVIRYTKDDASMAVRNNELLTEVNKL